MQRGPESSLAWSLTWKIWAAAAALGGLLHADSDFALINVELTLLFTLFAIIARRRESNPTHR